MIKRALLFQASADRLAVNQSDSMCQIGAKRPRLDELLSGGCIRTGFRLFKKISAGAIHAVEAQRIAADIVHDYGPQNHLVNGFASLGSNGSNLKSCRRDLMRWIKTFGIAIEPYMVQVLITHRCVNVSN
jgi:hypothetical protein